MQLPPIDTFRQADGVAHGPPFSIDPEGCDFTLTIPEGDVMFEPHEPSYRMAMDVLDELDPLTEASVEYLRRIVDFGRMGISGPPSSLLHVQVDARAEKVTISMVWDADTYAEWMVTFFWRDGMAHRWPNGMALRSR
jgi:hypothetical protein